MGKFPRFYDPGKVGTLYEPRIELAVSEGLKAGIPHSDDKSSDKKWNVLLGIDPQVGFILPGHLLTVKGAVDNIRRVIELIYLNPERFEEIIYTLDLHEDLHIFFPSWWVDREGNHPEPFTKITAEDVVKGRWRSVIMQEWSIFYVCQLGEIDIWPHHNGIGSDEARLLPSYVEAVTWFCAARNVKPIALVKGLIKESEFYGPFKPCVIVPGHPQGNLNTEILNLLARYGNIYEHGEAEDFCLRHANLQLLDYFAGRPDVIRRIHILKDCTSLVFPEKRQEADQVLAEFARKGVKIITSSELIGS